MCEAPVENMWSRPNCERIIFYMIAFESQVLIVHTIPYYAIRYDTLLHCTVLYFTVLYCILLYCTVLYCTIHMYIMLMYTSPMTTTISYDRFNIHIRTYTYTTLSLYIYMMCHLNDLYLKPSALTSTGRRLPCGNIDAQTSLSFEGRPTRGMSPETGMPWMPWFSKSIGDDILLMVQKSQTTTWDGAKTL